MVAAADPSPPPLTDDQVAILNAFINSNYDLAATSESANLTLPDLLAWHRAPAVQAALNDLEALQARADELQLAAARRDAVKELHGILRDAASDPVERRRAATALLRRFSRGTGSTRGPSAHPRPASGPTHGDTAPHSSAKAEKLAISRAIATLEANIDALARGAAGPAKSDAPGPPDAAAQPTSSETPSPDSELPDPPNPGCPPIRTYADFAAHFFATLSGAPPPHNSA